MSLKIHIEPTELNAERPAIVVVPDGANRWPLCSEVVIRCKECGHHAALVTQRGTSAHVIVESGEDIDVTR